MSNPRLSLAARTRAVIQQVLAVGQTRLEMVGLELEKERMALGREIRLAAICIVCAWLAGFTLVLWIVIALPQLARVWLLGILFALFAITAIVSGMTLHRAARRERIFTRLAAQLQLDQISLGETVENGLRGHPGDNGHQNRDNRHGNPPDSPDAS